MYLHTTHESVGQCFLDKPTRLFENVGANVIVTDRAVSQWVDRTSGNQRQATENGPQDIFWGREAAIVVKICRSGSANRVVVGAGRGPAMHVRSPAS